MLFKKKNNDKTTISCSCNGDCKSEVISSVNTTIESIKVLGMGCKSCHEQYQNVLNAVDKMGISTNVEYITDLEKVMSYGVMSMPVIVINDKVVSYGKVLKTQDVINLLKG